jgi:hypothetical protein
VIHVETSMEGSAAQVALVGSCYDERRRGFGERRVLFGQSAIRLLCHDFAGRLSLILYQLLGAKSSFGLLRRSGYQPLSRVVFRPVEIF